MGVGLFYTPFPLCASVNSSDLIPSDVCQIHCQVNVVRNQKSRKLGQLVHDEVGLRAWRDEGSLENDSSEETSIPKNGSNRDQTSHRMTEHEARQVRILKLINYYFFSKNVE